MLRAIIDNPFRYLGVYSNSPKKELIANKGKILAFARVNKSMPFPLDLNWLLPKVVRTQEEVDRAESELALSINQIKHAQFWFTNVTPVDEIAFNYLLGEDLNAAMQIWKKSVNMSSLQNLFVCYLIKGDYNAAIQDCAVPLYRDYREAFVAMIDEKLSLSGAELSGNIVQTLYTEGIDLSSFSNTIYDKEWKQQIESQRVNPLFAQLESLVSEAKSVVVQNSDARLKAGRKLQNLSAPLLNELKSILLVCDTRYQIIADKVALEALLCSIDYYNNTKELDAPVKALPICSYAKSIAVGNAAKQRCNDNYIVIKKAYDNMPPLEVINEAKEINDLISWYGLKRKTSINGLELLKKARIPLIAIKERFGKKNLYYLEMSSALGNAALSCVIEDINNVLNDEKSSEQNNEEERFQKDKSEEEERTASDEFLVHQSESRVEETIWEKIVSFFNNLMFELGLVMEKPMPKVNIRLQIQLSEQKEAEERSLKANALDEVLKNACITILYIDALDTTWYFKQNRFEKNRRIIYKIVIDKYGCEVGNRIIKGYEQGINFDPKYFWSAEDYFTERSNKLNIMNLESPSDNYVAEYLSRIHRRTVLEDNSLIHCKNDVKKSQITVFGYVMIAIEIAIIVCIIVYLAIERYPLGY